MSLLTPENLSDLELHCERQTHRESGTIKEEHEIVLELLHCFYQQQKEIEKNQKENTDLKELYMRIANNFEKRGKTEIAEYMLAQIQAVPTFSSWEEYKTWISKDKIREIIKMVDKDIEKNRKSKIIEDDNGTFQQTLICYKPELGNRSLYYKEDK